MSLKELVEKHGFGIRVHVPTNKGVYPFKILGDSPNDEFYFVEYQDMNIGIQMVKKECEQTNDYELLTV